MPGIFAIGDVRNGTNQGVAAAIVDGNRVVAMFQQYLASLPRSFVSANVEGASSTRVELGLKHGLAVLVAVSGSAHVVTMHSQDTKTQ